MGVIPGEGHPVDIAMARLMARPDARLCVACAELAERK